MDTLRLEGGGKIINLYAWLNSKVKGHEALAGILGFGMPGVENFWFDGAGSGSTWRGARVKRRTIQLPMKVYAANRSELNELLSDLAVALDPVIARDETTRGVARLYFGMPDDREWFVDVVRVSGGDWSRKVDSDDRTFFKTTLVLEAADAFWTRNSPEEFIVRQDADGPTLLPRMAKLRVGSAAVFGEREVTNIGDTYAWPTFEIRGPITSFLLVGPNGERVEWEGTLAEGETITLDMRSSVIEDDTETNRYDGLLPAPRFWAIAPGTSQVGVQADGITSESRIIANWWPRRWGVV